MSFLSKLFKNVCKNSLKFLHENILRTSLKVNVIASIIFYIFLKNIYVIIMSADTPECAKLNYFLNIFFGGTCP